MSKPLPILITVLCFLGTFLITWYIAKGQGYQQGKADGSHALQLKLDSIEAIERKHADQAGRAFASAVRHKAIADSVLAILNAPRNEVNYPKVPVGIGATDRRIRILEGTADPIR